MSLLGLFWEFLKAGMLSFGGFGNLPIITQSLVVDHGWTTNEQVGQALAVGRISPGPNGLWIVALGYLMMGFGGALVVTAANIVPSLVILPLSALHRRVAQNSRVIGAMRMVALAVTGTLFWTAFTIVRGAAHGPGDWALALAAPALVILRPKWNPVLILAAAALIGLFLHY